MSEQITLLGRVAHPPRFLKTAEGLAVCSFRLSAGWARRPGERAHGPERNWYTVTAVRQLAEHARRSLAAGDRVILTGTLRLLARPGGERGGVTAEVDAVSIGHDLRWQEARSLRRAPGQAPSDAAQPVPPPRHLPRTQPSQAAPREPDVQPAAVSRA